MPGNFDVRHRVGVAGFLSPLSLPTDLLCSPSAPPPNPLSMAPLAERPPPPSHSPWHITYDGEGKPSPIPARRWHCFVGVIVHPKRREKTGIWMHVRVLVCVRMRICVRECVPVRDDRQQLARIYKLRCLFLPFLDSILVGGPKIFSSSFTLPIRLPRK